MQDDNSEEGVFRKKVIDLLKKHKKTGLAISDISRGVRTTLDSAARRRVLGEMVETTEIRIATVGKARVYKYDFSYKSNLVQMRSVK